MIASKHIFGGGAYSVAGSSTLRTVGNKRWPISEITIGKVSGGQRDERGQWHPAWAPPSLPKKISDPYHPCGNSAGYLLQTAHLMGCDPIYLLGFTLESGSGYFFGLDNPVTRRRSLYDTERALAWLRWYQERYPGRAKLWPGWTGPIYKVLETLDARQAEALSGTGARHEPDQDGPDVHEV